MVYGKSRKSDRSSLGTPGRQAERQAKKIKKLAEKS